MTERKVALLSSYVKVKRAVSGEMTFGGDQNFFARPRQTEEAEENKQQEREKKKQKFKYLPEDEKKRRMGCGIIALGDIFLYLSGKNKQTPDIQKWSYVNREMGEKEYCDYYNTIYTFVGKITKSGISGLRLWRKFNQMARRQGWQERAFWGFSKKKMFPRIEEMLGKDIPVILCIPMALFKKHSECKLPLYKKDTQGNYVISTAANGHYVVVTEVFYEGNETYLVISSWGKQYFVKWKEYEQLVSGQFLGAALGNLLYIR